MKPAGIFLHKPFKNALARSLAILAGIGMVQPLFASEPSYRPTPQEMEAARAKQAFEEGVRHMESEDLEGALESFRASQAIVPRASTLRNIGACLKRQGRYVQALESYEQVRAKFGPVLSERDRVLIQQAIEELEKKVGELFIASDVRGILYVDGIDRGSLPLSAPMRLDPGEHMLRIEQGGRTVLQRKLQVSNGVLTYLNGEPSSKAPSFPGARKAGAVAPLAQKPRKAWQIQSQAALVMGASLGSDLERSAQESCAENCPGVLGALAGLRVSVPILQGLPFSLSIDAGGRYIGAKSSFSRTVLGEALSDGRRPSYTLQHELSLEGGMGELGASAAFGTGGAFRWTAHAGIAVLGSTNADEPKMSSVKLQNNAAVAVNMTRPSPIRSLVPAMTLELALSTSTGRLHMGAWLGAVIAPMAGSNFTERVIRTNCLPTPQAAAIGGNGNESCNLSDHVMAPERAQGAFLLFTPGISLGVDL